MPDELVAYSDGGARGNPGPAAIGVIIKTVDDKIINSFGRYLGEMTNNQAEYYALIAALEEAKRVGAKKLECRLDSELLVKQMRREYRVKDKKLQPLFLKSWNLAATFKNITFTYIPREQNHEADAEVNRALDKHWRQSKFNLALTK